jgi:hypothetical protein
VLFNPELTFFVIIPLQQVIEEGLDFSTDEALYTSYQNKKIRHHLTPEFLAAQVVAVLHRSDMHGNIKNANKNQQYNIHLNLLLINKFQAFCSTFPDYTFFGGVHGNAPRFRNGGHYAQCSKDHQLLQPQNQLDSSAYDFLSDCLLCKSHGGSTQ